MSGEELSFSGELLGSARRPVRHFSPGRVCEEPGCDTRLSIYNSRARCAMHDFDESLLHFRTVPSASLGYRAVKAGGDAPAHHPHAA